VASGRRVDVTGLSHIEMHTIIAASKWQGIFRTLFERLALAKSIYQKGCKLVTMILPARAHFTDSPAVRLSQPTRLLFY
jgi:hypothetical protein